MRNAEHYLDPTAGQALKSLLRYPGAKWRLADWIIKHMPAHKIYLEPFFGSGAVFFNKHPCNTEIINDLDGDVVNLFKCMRDYPSELANLINLTPYSQIEYAKSYDRSGCSKLEQARRFIVRCNMARGGMLKYSTSWRHCGLIKSLKCWQGVTKQWDKLPKSIMIAAARLKNAEIACQNAVDLIKKYNHQDCLIYADPPYLLNTRKQRYYQVEMDTVNQHTELLEVLQQHKGPVLLSGYDSELYNNMLADWDRVQIRTTAEKGLHRTEVLWIKGNSNDLRLFN